MKILLSQQSDKSIYEQIAEQIKNDILKGNSLPNDALPSIRKLAKELQVSVITTKKAYEKLEREGFIYTRAGKGCFVAEYDNEKIKSDLMFEIQKELKMLRKKASESGISKREWIELIRNISEEEF